MSEGIRRLRIEILGEVPYRPMLALQRQRHAEVIGGADDTLFLLEHPAVVTLGKNCGAKNVLLAPAALAAQGIDLVETDRGGDVTFHGPGQLVGYPIVKLDGAEQDVKAYVFKLEELMIRTVADFGVVATRSEGLRGVWVGKDKIAAIGVRIAQWTTLHGFALNVTTDLHRFDCIIPCGLRGRGVTSLTQVLGKKVAMSDVIARLAAHVGPVLGRAACAIEARE